MQFSLTTGEKNGILQKCEYLLDLGDTGISSNSTLLAQITGAVNNAMNDIIAEILKNEGDYIWDDSNYTDFPIATTNLVTTAGSEQSDYTLPTAGAQGDTDASSFLRLTAVKIKDAAGNWQKILAIGEDTYQQPLETIFKDAGFPKWYRQLGNSIRLFPAPLTSQVTATAGLRMEFQRDQIAFVTGDTTKEPGFPSIYHHLVPLLASESYAAIKGMRQLGWISNQITKAMQNLGWGIANRNKDQRQRIISLTSRRNPRYE
jgi:hypothetical protein